MVMEVQVVAMGVKQQDAMDLLAKQLEVARRAVADF